MIISAKKNVLLKYDIVITNFSNQLISYLNISGRLKVLG
ncbi:hypothetical protein BDGGKGIB_01856 [Nodularia sphaerocarpa UHCC 0038]|nr:hypothetical protein BDGGKGIB_01856 [Nodularia sphaerocarpa UHCC 0038]